MIFSWNTSVGLWRKPRGWKATPGREKMVLTGLRADTKHRGVATEIDDIAPIQDARNLDDTSIRHGTRKR